MPHSCGRVCIRSLHYLVCNEFAACHMRSSRSSRYTIGSKLLAPLLFDHCRLVTVDWSLSSGHSWLIHGLITVGWSLAGPLHYLFCAVSSSLLVTCALLAPAATLLAVIVSCSLWCCLITVGWSPLIGHCWMITVGWLLVGHSAVAFPPLSCSLRCCHTAVHFSFVGVLGAGVRSTCSSAIVCHPLLSVLHAAAPGNND